MSVIFKIGIYLAIGCTVDHFSKAPDEEPSLLIILLWPIVMVLFVYTMIMRFSFWLANRVIDGLLYLIGR